MSLFVDRLLLQLSNSTQLIQLLDPPGDANHTRLRALLNTMYDLEFATIHDVRNVQVRRAESERLLLTTHPTRGTWTQTIPSYTRTDVVYEGSDKLEPLWFDIGAEIGLTLLLEVDAGEVESIVTHAIENFKTLAEFQAHFLFFDLAAFMAEHGITAVDELREYAQYLLAEIRLRTPPVFDPNNPANLHSYTLDLAVFIRETIDVAGALHDVKLARIVTERTQSYRKEFEGNEILVPYAPIVIFPEAALAGLPFDANALQTFFATEGVLALFLTPA